MTNLDLAPIRELIEHIDRVGHIYGYEPIFERAKAALSAADEPVLRITVHDSAGTVKVFEEGKPPVTLEPKAPLWPDGWPFVPSANCVHAWVEIAEHELCQYCGALNRT